MSAFTPAGGGTSTGGGSGTITDPNMHTIREIVTVEDTALLIVTAPAILFISDGNAGRFATIGSGSTVEYG